MTVIHSTYKPTQLSNISRVVWVEGELCDLGGAEAALVLLAQLLLQSDQQMFDLINVRLGDQRLGALDFRQQLLNVRPALPGYI